MLIQLQYMQIYLRKWLAGASFIPSVREVATFNREKDSEHELLHTTNLKTKACRTELNFEDAILLSACRNVSIELMSLSKIQVVLFFDVAYV